MKSKLTLHANAYVGAVSLIVLALFAFPIADGGVNWANDSLKGLEPDQPLLQDTLPTDYTIRYVYTDVADESRNVELSGTHTETPGTNIFDEAEVRTVEVDLGLATFTAGQEPLYEVAGDSKLVIELGNETADILYEENVRSMCLGLDIVSGHIDPKNSTMAGKSYQVNIGAGDAVFYSFSATALKDKTDADTNKRGECDHREDPADAFPEFAVSIDTGDIKEFILDAYARDGDVDKPENLWIEVVGARAPDGAAEDLGDVATVGLQFYTYPATAASLGATGLWYLSFAAIGGVLALLLTTVLNVPGSDVKPHIRKIRKGGN